jgi:protein Tex
VAAFGAFVDIGVHQDGLVHVSAMSRNFVSDPRSVVKSGDVVRVKVLSVDMPRHRISLTLRLDDEGPRPAGGRARAEHRPGRRPGDGGRTPGGSRGRSGTGDSGAGRPGSREPGPEGALADALRRAGLVPSTPEDPDRRRRR